MIFSRRQDFLRLNPNQCCPTDFPVHRSPHASRRFSGLVNVPPSACAISSSGTIGGPESLTQLVGKAPGERQIFDLYLPKDLSNVVDFSGKFWNSGVMPEK
jgi:hypothetical protein